MDRKVFLKTLSSAALAAACPPLLAGCAGLPYVTGVPSETGMHVSKASLEGMEFALLNVPGYRAPVFLARDPAGAFSAVSLLCTHKGCVVKPANNELACPCHGSRFTFAGEVLEGPADIDLVRYEVEEIQATLTIRVQRT